MDAKIDDEVEVKTELKTHQELKCVVMGLDGKQEFVLDHSSQYTHSMINFCKQLMSNVKDEQILCQIANERDVNNLSNPVDNVDVLSHRIEYAIDNDVKIVHFVIASIEKVPLYHLRCNQLSLTDHDCLCVFSMISNIYNIYTAQQEDSFNN